MTANVQTIAVLSSDFISDRWTIASPQKKNPTLLQLVLHIFPSEGPNIFLFNSLTIIIFICTEFVYPLHSICASFAQNDNSFVLGGKCNVDIPSYTISFYPRMESNSKNQEWKKCCLNFFFLKKRVCIFNSTSTSIHPSKTCITIKRVGNARGLLNRVFAKGTCIFYYKTCCVQKS